MSEATKLSCKIQAVILAGRTDFGRCPLASRRPTSLWPIGDKPIIVNLLIHLRQQGITEATICFDGNQSEIRQAVESAELGMNIRFLPEPLPLGTAGCLREAGRGQEKALYLICPANMLMPVNVREMLAEHDRSQSDFVVALNPQTDNSIRGKETAGVYLSRPEVLPFIAPAGYCDIKETLIPILIRAGKKVQTVRLSHTVGAFRDWPGYLAAIADYFADGFKPEIADGMSTNRAKDVWISKTAIVHPSARIYGPTAILDGAQVEAEAVILGPAIVGPEATVGRSSFVESSVLWDRAQVGAQSEIRRCLLEYEVKVPGQISLSDQLVPYKKFALIPTRIWSRFMTTTRKIKPLRRQLGLTKPLIPKTNHPSIPLAAVPEQLPWFLAGAAIVAAFLWCYWNTLRTLWEIWMRSDEYSSGLLVPFLAVYLAWSRRKEFAHHPLKPSLWGLIALLAAQGLRFFGLYFMYGSAERLSVIFSIAALLLMLLGGKFFLRLLPIWIFLFLMLPLPTLVQGAIAQPLQRWATSSAVFCLETLGYEAIPEGNIIHIGSTSVAVAEACNGLRMVTAFFVISGLVVLLVKRPGWEKLLIMLSTPFVALLCNTVRLTITAVAFTMLTNERWTSLFHDFGGLAMMPLALAVVIFELWFFSKIVVSYQPTEREGLLVSSSSRGK